MSSNRAGARRYKWIWVAVIPIALWALVRVFGLERGSVLVALLAFTPYVAIAAFLIAGVALALRNWAAAAVAGLATLCLAGAVLPRAFDTETVTVGNDETLTVLSANVRYGTADPAGLVGLVERLRPDLLSVQELTPDLAAELRREGLDRLLPHSILAVQPGWPGRGIYSRLKMYPLAEGPAAESVLPHVGVRLPGGGAVRVVNVHPHTPVSGAESRWSRALERLPSAGSGVPWLLVGDFNATMDHAAMRDVVARGYRDAGEATGKGLEPTWPARMVVPPLITIDHLLADRRIGIAGYEVEELPGSDHRAIYARLVLP